MIFIIYLLLFSLTFIVILFSIFVKRHFNLIAKNALSYYYNDNQSQLSNYDTKEFMHYYFSNSGIFVAPRYIPFGIRLISSIYSFCMIMLMIAIIFSIVFFSVWYLGLSIIFLAYMFKSNTSVWFPTISSEKIFQRTALNYRIKYPNDSMWQTTGVEAFDKNSDNFYYLTLQKYFDDALKVTEMYYTRETN